MENEGIEKLFFELASESRLSILRELQTENLKMQEIARRLDVTATEAFRQLERLSAALLVQKQPEGTFAITQYGKLVLQLSSSLDFAFKHKEYFLTHDVWGIAEGVVPELMGPVMSERALKGLKLKFLIPENRLSAEPPPPTTPRNIEIRSLSDIPAIIAVTEKEAAACFRLAGRRMDYAGFYGKDPAFLNWVKELFLYYWDKGKPA
jgi:predicted transcriptional regulator